MDAVRLRLDGLTVAEVATRTGLSAPTVSAAWKAFRQGGWEAVPLRQRGRKAGQAERLDEAAQADLLVLLASPPECPDPAWSSRALANAAESMGHRVSPRAIEHWLAARGLKPVPYELEALTRRRSAAGRWYRHQVMPVVEQVRRAGGAIWQGGVRVVRPQPAMASTQAVYQLYLHGKRSALYTRCLSGPPRADDYLALFTRLIEYGQTALIFHGAYWQASPEIQDWLHHHPEFHLINVPADTL